MEAVTEVVDEGKISEDVAVLWGRASDWCLNGNIYSCFDKRGEGIAECHRGQCTAIPLETQEAHHHGGTGSTSWPAIEC